MRSRGAISGKLDEFPKNGGVRQIQEKFEDVSWEVVSSSLAMRRERDLPPLREPLA
jgi:hypothetical protein